MIVNCIHEILIEVIYEGRQYQGICEIIAFLGARVDYLSIKKRK